VNLDSADLEQGLESTFSQASQGNLLQSNAAC
jgi:hypothetical protein